jgi:leucyl-tRNA synthetase
MLDEVWDYVFGRTQLSDELVSKSGISKETLQGMRRDFEYFYPLDIRVSGKDLIPNHLTFFLYNHIGKPWPPSLRP